jgi:hypothetical protein
MREDAFLQACYRKQWLSGAYHEACLLPCERRPEGRDRLLHILRGSGCLRVRAS